MDFWLSNPDAIDRMTGKPFEWKVQANCPFCGDKSFVGTVYGIYHVGGYGIINPKDPTEKVCSTRFTGEYDELPNKVLFFQAIKETEDAKPQKVYGGVHARR